MPPDREDLIPILEVAKTLLRDLVVIKTLKEGSRLIHSDLQGTMADIASRLRLSNLLHRIRVLHQTLLDISPIRGNANTRLALEAMMLSWPEG
jgi:DNA polymerase III, delta subunit, C terminal